jgi:hypothetical protein
MGANTGGACGKQTEGKQEGCNGRAARHHWPVGACFAAVYLLHAVQSVCTRVCTLPVLRTQLLAIVKKKSAGAAYTGKLY